MRYWQKIWLWLVIIFFSYHIIRDILQDLGIKNILSTILVKKDTSGTPLWYWQVFNTYLIALLGLFFSLLAFKAKRFVPWGYLTYLLALGFFIVWLIYWLLL